MKSIYLDYAAATPVDKRVVAAIQPYLSDHFYNPSATYLAAQNIHRDIEAARKRVAVVLGARPADIHFAAGATEANNLAIHGIMQRYPDKKIIASSIEHESILSLAAAYIHTLVPVYPDGIVDMTALRRIIDDDTVLVSVMYANNEVGTIQPIREIAAFARSVREARRQAGNTLPLYIHTDATQAANYLDLHVARLGIDLLTLNGGKIYGPKQTGILFVRTGVQLQPLLSGGGQEHGIRSGTENVPGIIGFATALELTQAMRHDESQRLQGLQTLFIDLLQQKVSAAIINGSQSRRLPNNIHLTIPGQDNERVLMALDEAGIMAAAGSACSASDEEPSHVLTAMGIDEADARASLRFTMGRTTTEADIQRAVDELARIVA